MLFKGMYKVSTRPFLKAFKRPFKAFLNAFKAFERSSMVQAF